MEDQVKVFQEFLSRKGLKLTRPRQEILDAAFGLHEHFDAQRLHQALRNSQSNISLATVYRTLPLLEEAGLIQHSLRASSRDMYEHIYGHPLHTHWICDSCGKVQETPLHSLQEQLQKEAEGINFSLEEVNIQVRGICWKCRNTENEIQ